MVRLLFNEQHSTSEHIFADVSLKMQSRNESLAIHTALKSQPIKLTAQTPRNYHNKSSYKVKHQTHTIKLNERKRNHGQIDLQKEKETMNEYGESL